MIETSMKLVIRMVIRKLKTKEDLKTAIEDVSLTDMQRNVMSAILENLF